MSSLRFASPGRLWLLLAVVAVGVAYLVLQRRQARYAVRLPGLDLLASVAPSLGWRRHAPAALMLAAMATSTAAYAEPTATVQVPREQATIVVTLDVSLSMAAQDVDPDRITAAKAAAQSFISRLPERFNVALVAFSGTASVVVPATQDHEQVTRAITDLQLGGGTAIGEAVLTSLEAITALTAAAGGNGAARTGDPAAAHVVLLSDGANTAGRPVSVAVEQAQAAGIPVSTIAYGTEDGFLQLRQGLVRVPVDAPALAELAEQTDGRSYQAATGEELASVYEDIGSQVGTTTERREVSSGVAGLALAVAVAAGAAALRWSPRPV